MNLSNSSIVNTAHTAPAQQPIGQAEPHNDPLIHIVLTEANRAIHFVAGMVGSFFNAHQGSVNLSAAEPVSHSPAPAIDEEDEDFGHYPQTPNPEMFSSRQERALTNTAQTPNPEMFYARPQQTAIDYPQTPNPPRFASR
jgi:hypothetical protein